MFVEFSRKKSGSVVMKITRNNGSETWSKLRRGMEDHDLAHIAVENELKLKKGFFGLIDKGAEITDFEDKDKQPVIHLESNQTEYLVNHLQVEYRSSKDTFDLLSTLKETLESREIPMMSNLSQDVIDNIRTSYHQKIKELADLKVGAVLTYKIDI